MNEDHNVSVSVQARILPQIEGAETFEQQVQQLPGQIAKNVSQSVFPTGITQGLSPQQIQQIQQWEAHSEGLMAPFKNQIKDLLEDLSVDVAGGKLSQGQINKYVRKFKRLQFGAQEIGETTIEDLEDYQKGLPAESRIPPEYFQIMRGGLKQNLEEIGRPVNEISKGFEKWVEQLNKANESSKSFFEELRRGGTYAGAMFGVNQILSFVRTGAEIEAKGMTAFDMSGQMGQYSSQREFELYSDVKNRERTFQIIGTLLGGAAGFFAGGQSWLGAAAGSYIGQSLGNQFAGIPSATETGETQQELKVLGQTTNLLGGTVDTAINFDRLRALLRARYRGQNTGGRVGFGYLPEEEMQYKMLLGQTAGRYDDNLYREQMTFATATGLNPAEVMQLNLSGRVTGANYGLSGLAEGRNLTREIFGENASPQRIVDVLNEIKKINEEALKLNINADARANMGIAAIPELLFGTNNPYGRLGDLGGQSISILTQLMKPQNQAGEAFLFRSMGTNNLIDFNEMMKGGIYSGDNLVKILRNLRNETGGNYEESYWTLNSLLPNSPQGFIKKIAEITQGDNLDKFQQAFEEARKKVDDANLSEEEKVKANKKFIEEWTHMAEGAKSESEKMISEIRIRQLEIADGYRSIIKQMREDWIKNLDILTLGAENKGKMLEKILDMNEKAITQFNQFFADLGFNMPGTENTALQNARKEAFEKNTAQFKGFNPKQMSPEMYSELMENGIPNSILQQQLEKLGITLDTVNTAVIKLNENLDKGIKTDVHIVPDHTAAANTQYH